jgi:hypothetical protein
MAGRVNLGIQQLDVGIETRTEDNAFVRSALSVVRARGWTSREYPEGQEDSMNVARTTTKRGTLSGVDPALDRVPEKHEEERGRQEGHELEDWIVAEDRRLVNQLLRAVQRAAA